MPNPLLIPVLIGVRIAYVLLMQKLICKHKGLIPDPNVKACQPI